MVKLFLWLFLFWIAIFIIRILLMGGLDPLYRDSEISLLKPISNYLTSVALNLMPAPQNSILLGILIGDGTKIPFFLKKDLQATSTIHMMVVSGENLTILIGFLSKLVYIAGRTKTRLLCLLAIIFYSLLTGLSVPVIRAAVMVGFVIWAQLYGRKKTSWYILALTAGLLLIINPNWIFSISFQLSFVATFGVIVVSPIIENRLKWVPKMIAADLAVTLSAYFLTLPIIAYNFNQLSLVGILANILIGWTAPLIMISGGASLILGMINTTLGQIVGLMPSILITYILYIVEDLAKLPFAQLQLDQTSFLVWLGYYILLLAVLLILNAKRPKMQQICYD